MKKHELIKYAYDNYPKGTKVQWLSEVAEVGFIVSGRYKIPEGTLCVIDSENVYCCIFNGKKWIDKL